MSADQAPPIALPALEETLEETASPSGSTANLSKSAQKRQAKSERFAQLKLERRAREKEEKVAKRKEREEKAAAGEDLGPSDAKKRRVTRGGEGPVRPFDARIVIDLGFDEKMTEKEVGSLCSQLAYTYASHRRTRTPFTGLLFTSLNGRALKHLDGINDASYRRWKGAEWWTEDIDGLWSHQAATGDKQQAVIKGEIASVDDNATALPGLESTEAAEAAASLATGTELRDDEHPIPGAPASTPSARLKNRRPRKQPPQTCASCSRESVVYLTADAEDELLELQEGETYVIGGIVDRNRYKNLCATKARELNIRSARLPIGRYLADMPTRKVLTVNQVFDILIHWVSTRDWEQAMQKVMPKRKFSASGKKGKQIQDTSINDAEEDDEDEEPTVGEDGDATKPDSGNALTTAGTDA